MRTPRPDTVTGAQTLGTARLLHQRIERTLGELEDLGTADMEQASHRAGEAGQVFDVLGQVFSAADRVRSILR